MFVQIEDRGPVRWLTLSNPGKKNAIPASGWAELTRAFAEFDASAARVLIVAGTDEDFCSGADLSEGGPADETSVTEGIGRLKQVGRAALTLHRISKPTIAAVEGVAAGAGMNLALGCDVVLAGETARFSEIFVRRGLTLDFGGTWLLPRVVGLQRAKELAFSGRMVGAEEAVRIGLALELCSGRSLHVRAQQLAESFADGAPIPQMLMKRSMNGAHGVSFEEALADETQSQVFCFETDDVEEGVAAFLAKRSPEFRGC